MGGARGKKTSFLELAVLTCKTHPSELNLTGLGETAQAAICFLYSVCFTAFSVALRLEVKVIIETSSGIA